MLRGERLKLHPGTICELLGTAGPFAGELCIIKGWDEGSSKWKVKLVRQGADGPSGLQDREREQPPAS